VSWSVEDSKLLKKKKEAYCFDSKGLILMFCLIFSKNGIYSKHVRGAPRFEFDSIRFDSIGFDWFDSIDSIDSSAQEWWIFMRDQKKMRIGKWKKPGWGTVSKGSQEKYDSCVGVLFVIPYILSKIRRYPRFKHVHDRQKIYNIHFEAQKYLY
jgi:hypothetical protein